MKDVESKWLDWLVVGCFWRSGYHKGHWQNDYFVFLIFFLTINFIIYISNINNINIMYIFTISPKNNNTLINKLEIFKLTMHNVCKIYDRVLKNPTYASWENNPRY